MQRDYINKGKIKPEPVTCCECKRPFAYEKFYGYGYTFCGIKCWAAFDQRRKAESKI